MGSLDAGAAHRHSLLSRWVKTRIDTAPPRADPFFSESRDSLRYCPGFSRERSHSNPAADSEEPPDKEPPPAKKVAHSALQNPFLPATWGMSQTGPPSPILFRVHCRLPLAIACSRRLLQAAEQAREQAMNRLATGRPGTWQQVRKRCRHKQVLGSHLPERRCTYRCLERPGEWGGFGLGETSARGTRSRQGAPRVYHPRRPPRFDSHSSAR
jgi:hypothetical protein